MFLQVRYHGRHSYSRLVGSRPQASGVLPMRAVVEQRSYAGRSTPLPIPRMARHLLHSAGMKVKEGR